MESPSFPDFAKKLLTIHLVDGQHNYLIADPRFEQQGGRWFLVGNTPKEGSGCDWAAGVETAIAWDQVSAYRVFDSVDQYVERYARFLDFEKKRS